MYQIKRMFVRHIEENLFKYILVISVFAVGVLAGFLFSQNVSESLSEVLRQEIDTLVDGISGGSFDKSQILKTSFLKNLRIVFLIFIGGLSAFFLTVTFATLLSYGFSIGFTTGYLSLLLGVQGMAVTMVSVAFYFIINIPVYVILSVVTFNNCINKKYKDRSFGTYILIFALLFFILLISVGADAFVVPGLITFICS